MLGDDKRRTRMFPPENARLRVAQKHPHPHSCSHGQDPNHLVLPSSFRIVPRVWPNFQLALESNSFVKVLDRMEMDAVSIAVPSRTPNLTAPRPCPSSSDGPSSSRDTSPLWRRCKRIFRPYHVLWS